jgi:endoglucanase
MRVKYIMVAVYLLGASWLTQAQSWIRINQLGYVAAYPKTAVWCTKSEPAPQGFELLDAATKAVVYAGKAGRAQGAYGPFTESCRLDFSDFRKPGTYQMRVGGVESPAFRIGDDVYAGTADFALRYMRQQRCGYNPFLQDSCHTHDGYTMYGPMPDSTHIDVVGGWHDASDYLQYSTTSANAAYHLLAAYRDFPAVFGDSHGTEGLAGANGRADVLDEARWGLEWLLKMHPRSDWMFNQIADDRDHVNMRIPKEDPFYGKGFERPVYFCTGEPQGLRKYQNRATGTASTAGKFASAFALGSSLWQKHDQPFAERLKKHAATAFAFGLAKPGVCQTAPNGAPYFYEEDNWKDDMQLAAVAMEQAGVPAELPLLPYALTLAAEEPITPWLGADTATHYQWYPFINLGHYELARTLQGKQRQQVLDYYREGIERVWAKAGKNAFYRGIPFIWCSNNLTTSFAIQCIWYRQLSGDNRYLALEQACIDWLFGVNPWGTSFVYGLPADGDTPVDPHSAFTHLKNYPIDGGLVDGPVYGSIFGRLIGLKLYEPDEYADFQSKLVVYHDDYGDYSTNEPTMDGTASLVYLLAAQAAGSKMPVKKNKR